MVARHSHGGHGHRDGGDEGVGDGQGHHVDVVGSVEVDSPEVAGYDGQIDGETETDEKNH